jgi:hypothetical protein
LLERSTYKAIGILTTLKRKILPKYLKLFVGPSAMHVCSRCCARTNVARMSRCGRNGGASSNQHQTTRTKHRSTAKDVLYTRVPTAQRAVDCRLRYPRFCCTPALQVCHKSPKGVAFDPGTWRAVGLGGAIPTRPINRPTRLSCHDPTEGSWCSRPCLAAGDS